MKFECAAKRTAAAARAEQAGIPVPRSSLSLRGEGTEEGVNGSSRIMTWNVMDAS